MKPAPFEYAKAKSIDRALALLGEHADARLLAGGQSLIATLNMRLSAPKLLIDINALDELKRITVAGDWLEIGALVRHAEAERSPDIARHAPLIALALPHIAHPAIRNRGTIGGSVAYADPAAELPACLVALGAELVVASTAGTRTIKADDFFRGLFETALGPGDLLTTIRVPVATADNRYAFFELARRHGDYALVGLAAATRAGGSVLRDTRFVFFGVGPTPFRARNAEAALMLEPGPVEVLMGELDPDGDVHASAAAKKHLAGVLLHRAMVQFRELSP